MPKNNSSSLRQKLSGLLKHTIFMADLKKPVTLPNSLILLLKKMNNMRKSKLLGRYNHYYGPVTEYEFSPPNTHLVRLRRRIAKISLKKLCSDILLFSKCLGSLEMGFEIDRSDHVGMRDLTATIDESVDERAERFIQRFYEEMKRQRQEYNLLVY